MTTPVDTTPRTATDIRDALVRYSQEGEPIDADLADAFEQEHEFWAHDIAGLGKDVDPRDLALLGVYLDFADEDSPEWPPWSPEEDDKEGDDDGQSEQGP